jgi:hypothetical protein
VVSSTKKGDEVTPALLSLCLALQAIHIFSLGDDTVPGHI